MALKNKGVNPSVIFIRYFEQIPPFQYQIKNEVFSLLKHFFSHYLLFEKKSIFVLVTL